MSLTFLVDFVSERVRQVMPEPPSSATQYTLRWESDRTMPLAVERRGIKAVRVWLPAALTPDPVGSFIEIYNCVRGRNSNLPHLLDKKHRALCFLADQNNIEEVCELVAQARRLWNQANVAARPILR